MRGITLPPRLVRSASVIAIATGLALPSAAYAQTADAAPPADAAPQVGATASTPEATQDIVVTGIRASLERSIAIKRDSTGIVDAISAEDIGKFTNTNLAESLQRIPGVSIDRINGEGSTVTVRGFGAQYNLVTLNGRQLATSNIVAVGGDQGGDGAGGFGRSFDFANLASEGVKTLEVYKSGRAAVPSGGIGATINVVSNRPLDAHKPGLTGSIGVKADWDNSADACISCGAAVTPEASGIVSWSDPEQRIGVSVFGSYQKRNFSFPSVANNGWNIMTLSHFLDTSSDGAGTVTPSTKLNNVPTDPNVLVSVPDDSRYHFSEASRERINGQAVLQFRPTDSLTVTVDGLYAQLRESERRSTQSNWFNRPFDEVTFDDASNGIATTQYLHEVISGVKDAAFEQAYRAQKNRLYDIGGNVKWNPTDSLTLSLDGHFGKAESLPDNPNGQTSTTVAFNTPVVAEHSLYTTDGGFPQQGLQAINDCYASSTPKGVAFTKGNCDGVMDLGDLSGAVQRQFDSTQTQRIKELRLDAGWAVGGGLRFDAGGDYRETKTRQTQYNTRQVLGDWGNSLPPDIEAVAPGQVFNFCAVCKFDHHSANPDFYTLNAFRTEDATKLYNALYDHYIGITNDGVDHENFIDANNDNRVREKIWAAYVQGTWDGHVAGIPTNVVAGVRYENTKVYAVSYQTVPQAIVWNADNDFSVSYSTDQQAVTNKGSYDNFLPSVDIAFDITRTLKARVSYSKTIARAPYGSLFASTSVGTPPRPTALGGIAGGNSNNTGLIPLDSDNIDVSLEWYPRRDVYFSVGFFQKWVHNFIGNTLVNENLFGLRDPTSGQAGTRSGTAKEQLQSAFGAGITDVNLFTYTAILTKNNGDVAATNAELAPHFDTTSHTFDQGYVDQVLGAYDVTADNNDPLFNFSVNTPINNRDAKIHGFEFAGQYFLGDTGFGVSGSYTLVRGDVGIDVAAPPSVDQFALVGLSDTANATLMYDKYGFSARIAYNWRGKFLSQLNRDNYHSPVYTAPYGQLDLSLNYDISPHMSVSFEGVNLTEEGVHTYGREKSNTFYLSEGSARYMIGARYKF
ncbi:TonB-dependent receptor [Hephaestia mangrovi]|uniref:TonB-dependent receptor n=1 Tax=Hephaestia mangrovi TaxID=2873268 RepID=UPI001CA6B8C3|nr:TonB-dependent receptor [Hephaestia mangrovi]MBY8828340.1 TonB-dependent receptor [Hephaestia mangrovi]